MSLEIVASYILINQTLNIRQDKIMQRKYPIHFYIADSDFFLLLLFLKGYGKNMEVMYSSLFLNL